MAKNAPPQDEKAGAERKMAKNAPPQDEKARAEKAGSRTCGNNAKPVI